VVQTYRELIGKSVRLRRSLFEACEQVIANYPWINQKKDARITFFSKSFAVLDSTTLCFIFGDSYLIRSSWWTSMAKKYSLGMPEPHIRSAMRLAFDQFVLTACFQLIFSSMESSLRLTTKKLTLYVMKQCRTTLTAYIRHSLIVLT
jgi:hypothetical protein